MVRLIIWTDPKILETPAEQALQAEYDRLLEELDRQPPQQEAPPEDSSSAPIQPAPTKE